MEDALGIVGFESAGGAADRKQIQDYEYRRPDRKHDKLRTKVSESWRAHRCAPLDRDERERLKEHAEDQHGDASEQKRDADLHRIAKVAREEYQVEQPERCQRKPDQRNVRRYANGRLLRGDLIDAEHGAQADADGHERSHRKFDHHHHDHARSHDSVARYGKRERVGEVAQFAGVQRIEERRHDAARPHKASSE